MRASVRLRIPANAVYAAAALPAFGADRVKTADGVVEPTVPPRPLAEAEQNGVKAAAADSLAALRAMTAQPYQHAAAHLASARFISYGTWKRSGASALARLQAREQPPAHADRCDVAVGAGTAPRPVSRAGCRDRTVARPRDVDLAPQSRRRLSTSSQCTTPERMNSPDPNVPVGRIDA